MDQESLMSLGNNQTYFISYWHMKYVYYNKMNLHHHFFGRLMVWQILRFWNGI